MESCAGESDAIGAPLSASPQWQVGEAFAAIIAEAVGMAHGSSGAQGVLELQGLQHRDAVGR